MSLAHVDAAVRADHHVVRLGEVRRRVAGLSRGAEDEQDFAFGAELDNLMSVQRSIRGALEFPRIRRPSVGNPDVALAVDIHPVGPGDQPGTEALDDVTVGIELDDRIDVRFGARVGSTPVAGPDMHTVHIDVDRTDRTPGSPVRERAPVTQGLIGVGTIVDRFDGGVLGRARRAARGGDRFRGGGGLRRGGGLLRCRRVTARERQEWQ